MIGKFLLGWFLVAPPRLANISITMKFLIDSPGAVFGRKEEQGQASYTFVDSVTPLRYDEWADLWSVPLPEYTVGGWEEKGLFHSSLGYILSGFLGVGMAVLVTLLLENG
jgi:hypothetical protein